MSFFFSRHIQNIVRNVQQELSQSDGVGNLDNCMFRVNAALVNLQCVENRVEDHQDTYRRLLLQLQARNIHYF